MTHDGQKFSVFSFDQECVVSCNLAHDLALGRALCKSGVAFSAHVASEARLFQLCDWPFQLQIEQSFSNRSDCFSKPMKILPV